MARVPDADQGGLPVPRLDSCGADRARSGAARRSRAAHARAARPRASGMVKLLLQVADDTAGLVSRARSLHPAHQAEEHAAVSEGRRVDYASGAGVLRLVRVARAPSPAFLQHRRGGSPTPPQTTAPPAPPPARPPMLAPPPRPRPPPPGPPQPARITTAS